MRLLLVSNFYPPHARGGYEQWCQEVGEALAIRGHNVAVLTSSLDDAAPDIVEENAVTIYRQLHLEVVGGLRYTIPRILQKRNDHMRENNYFVRQVVADFQPDIVMIWGMWNLSRSVPAEIETLLGNRVVYYFCDYWPSLPSAFIQQLENPARSWITAIPKKIVSSMLLPKLRREKTPELQFPNSICVSQAVCQILQEKNVPIKNGTIIYGGTQIEQFSSKTAQRREVDSLKLVYIGRLSVEKDVVTAISAMQNFNKDAVQLDIIGSGNVDYELALREIAAEQNLNVNFVGYVPRRLIPARLAMYDALLFTSSWPEPFARTVLEAMAAGLVVIGTTTGGTGEVLVENETGFTFSVGDASELSGQIKRLLEDPELQKRLSYAAQDVVRKRFSFQRMVDDIEAYLRQMSASSNNSH